MLSRQKMKLSKTQDKQNGQFEEYSKTLDETNKLI
jgi:hypothetical protein